MCVVGSEGWEVGEKGSASAPGGERRVGLARAPWSLTKSPSDDAGRSGRCGLGTLPPAHGADVSLLEWKMGRKAPVVNSVEVIGLWLSFPNNISAST